MTLRSVQQTTFGALFRLRQKHTDHLKEAAISRCLNTGCPDGPRTREAQNLHGRCRVPSDLG